MTDIRRLNIPAIVTTGLALAGCATSDAPPGPEVRELLAPTGKLRVGVYPRTPTSLVRDPVSGEAMGVGHDVGMELARRLGVAFEAVEFPKNAEVLEAVKTGRVDVAFTNATAARARDMDFSPALLQVEQGYLVGQGSPISDLAEVDRPGVRVGVTQGSTSQGVLSRDLANATVVAVPTLKDAVEMLSSGKVDAFATNKPTLFEMADELPGSRVLAGRWGVESFALGIPKGRDQAMPFLARFAEESKRGGVVKRAVDRVGLRGTMDAEAK